jgi:RNA-directed DNA polymerase
MDEERQRQAAAVPGTAKQGAETQGQNLPDLSWMEAAIWTERMVSALENGVKGGVWHSLIDKVYAPKTLALAWRKVKANGGAAGVDGVSIERFEARAEDYLAELSESLKAGRYRPVAIRRVEIPKGDGATRPLGIPAVKDRIAQTAVKLVIEPIFEVRFHPSSYGFRPGRSCKDLLREVDRLVKNGYRFVVDADLKGYFDSIPHERLMERVKARIADGRLLDLLHGWLKQDVLKGMERWTPTEGAPQGAVISPLLANIYLHPLDELMASHGYKMARYADDFVVLRQSREEAEAALALIRAFAADTGLTLHPDKTRVGNSWKKGGGFSFLGYSFEGKRRHIRKKSLDKLKEKIRAKTGRTCGKSLKQVIAGLNPVLRGWFEYFKHAHHPVFKRLDGLIRRRLRALLRKQDKRPSFGRCLADQRRWTNAFFADAGLFALHTAWQEARGSR